MGANSVSNIGAFTASTRCGPRGTGPGSSQRASGPWAWPWRLDHSQASARPTRPAWSGLRSTYRRTTKQRWINIADGGDVVALVKDLRPSFGVNVENHLIYNGATAHDIRPYLTAKETGNAIATGLR